MLKIPPEVVGFFRGQGFVIVSTIDRQGKPHSSCKGIVKIDESGQVFLLDVYRAKTLENLKNNSSISITAVDEHKFKGYCLKGKAGSLDSGSLNKEILDAWDDRITGRVTQRVLKNIHGEKGHSRHPETQMPKPEYMIVMTVEEIVDLSPHNIS
jgi:predicted pyridoxine 5'-phosphate oxidase superfamily flavin-nucleotide-binding protein